MIILSLQARDKHIGKALKKGDPFSWPVFFLSRSCVI
jgi:hypothetical protein